MKKIWQQRQKFSDDVLEQLLKIRGIEAAGAEEFLNPAYERSHDPFLLKDMDRAVERILKATRSGERITVYADYDADAVTAAAVLLRFFREIGYEDVDYYIPDRFSEGYGMNTDAIKQIAEKGTKLIITVDCGINAFEAIDLANELGMDVVITDHHQLPPSPTLPTRLPDGQARGREPRRGKEGVNIPNAAAVVNPHRPDDEYPFKDLTGVGVAFKLVQALCNTPHLTSPTRGEEFPSLDGRGKGRVGGWEKWLLDLVAIGTVADCQSLLGENRIFVKWGMYVMAKTRWPGLKKLMEKSGIEGPLDTYKIGFMIAPRINAAGRIEHANIALELMLTDNPDRAQTLADKLDELNRQRQNLTEQILSEAREQLAEYRERKILLAAGQDWPQGIVGLVAGKLTEEFYRPVLVLSKNGEEAVGSARSIANFNIVEAIGQSHEILLRFGGHPQAAGFTLLSEHIEMFHKNLLDYAEDVMDEEALAPVLLYDAEIKLDEIDSGLVDLLEKFAPFGIGNPRPRVRINVLRVSGAKAIGKEGKHLRMYVSDNDNLSPNLSPDLGRGASLPRPGEGMRERSKQFPCIGFNLGFWADKMKDSDKIDIICEPQWNEWNGDRSIQLKIIDINVSTDK